MQFETSRLVVNFENGFIATLDKWKKLIFVEGIKKRMRKLIEKDIKELEKNA